MWFFPVLSILTLAGITAVPVQMAFDRSARSQLWLSLLSWVVVIGLYFIAQARGRIHVGARSLRRSKRRGQPVLVSNTACSNGALAKTGRHFRVTCSAASALLTTRGSVSPNVLP